LKQAVTAYIPGPDGNHAAGYLTDEHPLAKDEVVLYLAEAPDLVLRPTDLPPSVRLEIPSDVDDSVWDRMQLSGFTLEEDLPF
jgi:hypothetical protein